MLQGAGGIGGGREGGYTQNVVGGGREGGYTQNVVNKTVRG
jgi:hypothetical protein